MGEVKVCRQADVSSGGRWLHLTCVPGGLKAQYVLQSDGAELLPAVVEAIARHAAQASAPTNLLHPTRSAQTPESSTILHEEEDTEVAAWEDMQDMVTEDLWMKSMKASGHTLGVVLLCMRDL